jgi:PAS domain S-box-containing protein
MTILDGNSARAQDHIPGAIGAPDMGSHPFQPDFRDFFDNAAVALHIVDSTGIIQHANQTELDMLGYRADEYIGRHIAEFHYDKAALACILDELASGARLDKRPAQLICKDGSLKDVIVSSSGNFANGEFVNTRCVTIDVSEVKALRSTVAAQGRSFQQILDALPAAIYTTDNDGIVTYFNKAAREFAGREPIIGRDQWCVTWKLHTMDGHSLPHDRCPMAVAVKEMRPVRNVMAYAERPDGTRVPFMPFPTPLLDDAGNMTGAINMLVDMTEVKQTESRLKLLVREIDHRGNNLLAVISAAVNLTDADDVPAFRKAVLGRIQALANSQRLLSQSHWQRAKLRDMFNGELAPYGKERCMIEGDDIELKPAIAQAFAIVIHELATNAAKYGALSEPGGRVAISWLVENDELKVCWSERGGPQISARPQRKGFGTTAVSATVKYTMHGRLDVEWLPDGLRCVISLPCSRLRPTPGDELTASLSLDNI